MEQCCMLMGQNTLVIGKITCIMGKVDCSRVMSLIFMMASGMRVNTMALALSSRLQRAGTKASGIRV